MNSDGTLREAVASVDSTKLADEIPLGEFLKTGSGLGGTEALIDDTKHSGDASVNLTVSTKQVGFTYTLTKLVKMDATPCKPGKLTLVNTDSFTIKPLGSKPAAPKATPLLNISATVSESKK